MVNKYYAGYKSSELITQSLIKDYAKLQEDTTLSEKEFRKLNTTAYTVAINTWLSLMDDVAGLPDSIPRALSEHGLAYMISKSNQIAKDILQNNLDPSTLGCFGQLYYNLMDRYRRDQIDESDILLCFRYLKRFSPEKITVQESSTVDGFLKRNKYANTQNQPNGWLEKQQWRVYQYMLPTTTALERLMSTHYPKCILPLTSDGTVPDGAVREGCGTIAQKVLTIEKFIPNYLHTSGVRATVNETEHTTSFRAVPKTAESSRGIAVEECYRTVLAEEISIDLTNALYEYSNGRIDLHDQERNQILCRRAAVSGNLACLDYSAASDSVYLGHVINLFPRYQHELMRWRPHYVTVNNRNVRLNLFATMGSRLTFPVETSIFLAIAEGAYRYYENLFGEHLDYSTIGVYGDDLIVDCRVVDIVFWFSRVLGLTINKDKSYYSDDQRIQVFGNSRYRESCGTEVICKPHDRQARDVSHPFYPRKGIPQTSVGIVSMISLQHKLVKYSRTNEWLTSYIRDIFHKTFPNHELTESYVGSDYMDLWSYWPEISTSKLPLHDGGPVKDDQGMYEYHTAFKPRYKSSRNVPFTERDAAYRYLYSQFLKCGNKSSDKLLSLLGVTTPLTPPQHCYCEVDEEEMDASYTF